MTKEEKTIPLSAVELMADLQYANLTNSTKMVAECDLLAVRSKLGAIGELAEARELLVEQMVASGKMGIRLSWVEKATNLITGVVKELGDELRTEDRRLVEKIASLEQEIEEYNRKREERKQRKKD